MLKEKPDNRQVPFPYSHRERARPAPSHLTFAIIWMKPVLHQDLASRQCGFRGNGVNVIVGKHLLQKVPLLIISRCWITAFGNKGSEVGLDFSGGELVDACIGYAHGGNPIVFRSAVLPPYKARLRQ
ncbi:hypothetical protein, partial [Stenotrophomonas maltophilia]|uniref:hypothetical protein n=1 Tax=Stenotrophomonas maltophilia TaxID=40324 RepID=UPI0039C28EB6